MARYAQVIINISLRELDRAFTYRIPGELTERLRLGSLVVVPFGRGNVPRTGYIIGFTDTCGLPEGKIKDIVDVKREGTNETGDYAIRLAAWMQKRYGSTMAAALKTVLTGRRQAKPVETRSVTLLLEDAAAQEKLRFYESHHQVARARVMRGLMESRTQPYTLITKKLHVAPATLKAMEKAGILRIQSRQMLRNPVSLGVSEEQPLTLSPEQEAIAEGVLEDFHALQESMQEARHSGLAVPRPEDGISPGKDMDSDSYGRKGSESEEKSESGEEGRAGTAEGSVPPAREASGVSVREASGGACRVSLIYGITGSGKTEVYIRIIKRIVAEGRQAIMLVPEIALTYQTLLRFYRHFGNRVSVMNSSLSEGEKSDQFERARRGEIDVIIGPRSALFTPFPRIGVIVIDEEHEASYKNEQMPKYHARETAIELARMHGAVVVLGSATPSIDSYDRAMRGEYRLYRLERRLTGGELASAAVIDMREELRAGNRSILSRNLSERIADRLGRGEQTMLFLNRRGYSGFVSCRSCGYVPKCPHCSVSLSLHHPGTLVCHYCGHTEPAPSVCPECGSTYIRGFHAGTEQVETMLQAAFPTARILRMDADTTRTKGSYEQILTRFANEEADILIGTQMIVKGHDFPNVTLMGVLLADMSLQANDYRAAERTFQLLTQAAGRAGRGSRPGEVVIQTYEPEHYAIVHAAHQDYEAFYREEIAYRRVLRYPPAEHLLAVQIISKSEDHAQLFAGQTRLLLEKLCEKWRPDRSSASGSSAGTSAEEENSAEDTGRSASRREESEELLIIGPAAASIEKLRDEYRYAVYIKSPDYAKLIACKDGVEAAAQRSREAMPEMDTYFQFDFDPVNPY